MFLKPKDFGNFREVFVNILHFALISVCVCITFSLSSCTNPGLAQATPESILSKLKFLQLTVYMYSIYCWSVFLKWWVVCTYKSSCNVLSSVTNFHQLCENLVPFLCIVYIDFNLHFKVVVVEFGPPYRRSYHWIGHQNDFSPWILPCSVNLRHCVHGIGIEH